MGIGFRHTGIGKEGDGLCAFRGTRKLEMARSKGVGMLGAGREGDTGGQGAHGGGQTGGLLLVYLFFVGVTGH